MLNRGMARCIRFTPPPALKGEEVNMDFVNPLLSCIVCPENRPERVSPIDTLGDPSCKIDNGIEEYKSLSLDKIGYLPKPIHEPTKYLLTKEQIDKKFQDIVDKDKEIALRKRKEKEEQKAKKKEEKRSEAKEVSERKKEAKQKEKDEKKAIDEAAKKLEKEAKKKERQAASISKLIEAHQEKEAKKKERQAASISKLIGAHLEERAAKEAKEAASKEGLKEVMKNKASN